MKSFKILMAFIICAGVFTSCLKDECNSSFEIYTYEPVYMTKEEMNNQSITTEPSFPLKNPGKIYYYGNALFVSEIGEGVHIFDINDESINYASKKLP